MENDPLANLIKQCQRGDAEAFTTLLHKFGPKLYRFFRRLTGSDTDAEDLLQETFTKLLSSIRKYRYNGRFESWLFQVAVNLLRDKHRRQQRRPKEISLHDDDNNPKFRLLEPAVEQAGPLERLQTSEAVESLQVALMALSPQDREIIMLRHYSNLSYQEIAEQLNIPKGTALARVHRGLNKLKKIMSANRNTRQSCKMNKDNMITR